MTEFKELIKHNLKVMTGNKWFAPAMVALALSTVAYFGTNIYIFFGLKKMDKVDKEIKELEKELEEV